MTNKKQGRIFVVGSGRRTTHAVHLAKELNLPCVHAERLSDLPETPAVIDVSRFFIGEFILNDDDTKVEAP